MSNLDLNIVWLCDLGRHDTCEGYACVCVCHDLRAEIGRLRTALDAIGHERNTWARQLADLADERDTALQAAELARIAKAEVESERDVLALELDEAVSNGRGGS